MHIFMHLCLYASMCNACLNTLYAWHECKLEFICVCLYSCVLILHVELETHSLEFEILNLWQSLQTLVWNSEPGVSDAKP